MFGIKYIPLVMKQLVRHRARSILTIVAVATAMFLFASVGAMQAGVKEATETTARDTTLIVYRQNRYCPFTSRLPEFYGPRIAKIPGVRSVIPMRVVVNNCRTSLDVVTFRGVPQDRFVESYAPSLHVISGSLADWSARTDAALLGQTLAARRGLRAGDRFDAAGITVCVAGVVRSNEPQDQNVAYVHLDFLQRSAGDRKLGIVTEFNVKVDDPQQLDRVAKAIDAEFANDSEPTQTSAEKAFVARAAGDVVRIVGFTRWLGWGCLAAVLALVGNAITLAVQERIRAHAVLQTLGFTSWLITRLIVAESALLGLIGGAIGSFAALLFVRLAHLSLSNEGFSVHMRMSAGVLLLGLLLAASLGAIAGLIPAWQASRREITACFRAV